MAKRVTFKKVDVRPTNELEVLTKLREHLILSVKVSDYNAAMVLKMTKMLIKKYKILEPDEAFGKRVYILMNDQHKSGNYIKNVMKTIEYWAASQGNMIRLPRPERVNHRIDYLKPNEARQLLEAAENIRNRAMIAVFLWCGLRQKELINVNVENYESRERLLWIVSNNDEDIRYRGVKNKTEQNVTVPLEAARYIEEYIKERPIVETHALFITRDGRRFSPRGIDDMLKRTAHRAGLGRSVSAHVLRHTMVTLACATNTNLFFVQRQARHSSPVITEKYAHAAAEIKMLRSALDDASKTMF